MKYKIGDKVKIKSVLEVRRDYPSTANNGIEFTESVVEEMLEFAGKEAKIVDDSDDEYLLDIDDAKWNWVDSMFENE